MSTGDDEFERRLRKALHTPRPTDRVDADDFLADVHRGAKVRRVRRSIAVGASVTAIVGAGGGIALSTGLLDGDRTPTAGPSSTFTSTVVTSPPSTTPSPTRKSGVPTPPLGPVTMAPKGPIAAGEVIPVSLTATGTAHQWVLAKTPGRDCGRPACATIFSTDGYGQPGSWTDVGQLPADPASSDDATAGSVSQLRFAKDAATYDGWAYGNALWSTHDAGHTWSAVKSPAGQVTQLEASDGYVYAGVTSSAGGTAQLYRSPISSDDWRKVPVGGRLTNVQSLAAAIGIFALIDAGPTHSTLYVSTNGVAWHRAAPCPAGSEPSALSTASDAAASLGSLWVSCLSSTETVITYVDTDHLGRWMTAQGTFGPGVVVAARTPMYGMVAGPGIAGIESVSSATTATYAYSSPVGPPIYFGFTNANDGYLLNSAGGILSTRNGGGTWTTYAVGDTTP